MTGFEFRRHLLPGSSLRVMLGARPQSRPVPPAGLQAATASFMLIGSDLVCLQPPRAFRCSLEEIESSNKNFH